MSAICRDQDYDMNNYSCVLLLCCVFFLCFFFFPPVTVGESVIEIEHPDLLLPPPAYEEAVDTNVYPPTPQMQRPISIIFIIIINREFEI